VSVAVKLLGVGEARSRSVQSILNQLRVVLSILLTRSITENIDDICTEKLGSQHHVVLWDFPRGTPDICHH
jgi:hypothetical protein